MYIMWLIIIMSNISSGDELENVTEAIVSEGLVEVRRGGIKPSE